MKNTEISIFENNRNLALRDSRKVTTLVRAFSGGVLPDPLLVYELILQKTKLPAVLMESATHEGEKGEYTHICPFGKPFYVHHEPRSLAVLKRKLRDISPLPHPFLPFVGGAGGSIGHEAISCVEKTVKLHPVDPFNLPVVALYTFHCVIVLDHRTNTLYYVANVPTSLGLKRGYKECCRLIGEMEHFVADSVNVRHVCDVAMMENLESNLSKEEYVDMVERAKEHINKGNVFQVVLSRRLSVPFFGNGVSLYKTLRSINPSPYLFHMRTDKRCDNAIFLGSSPEIMVDIRNREMVIRPLAGTRKRGKTPAGDKRNEKALLNNKKERAEHKMLVDLALHDVSKYSTADSVVVTELMQAEYCGSVIHMASEVRGRLRDDIDPIDAFFGVTPAGTLSGCPKVRALQVIEELEPCQRGPYGGSFGWFTDLSVYTCIFIRSALLLKGVLYWQTGAGIVSDSNPEAEYSETEKKAASIKRALIQMQKIHQKISYEKKKSRGKSRRCG
ncbi:MAG: anthranilate synthase component I family protein [Candidatus Taylorbacteria bacterium]|nr:anthranilate synthase component I family protein [Candidatus Taylorbacteria bacterium]